MRLPHWIRYILLVKKIERHLPKYHPDTGERLYWDIRPGRYRRVGAYDTQTGKARTVFTPVPQIYHPLKQSSRVTNDSYKYLWPTKEIISSGQRSPMRALHHKDGIK